MNPREGAGSSVAARLFHHFALRRHRVYALIGVALVLVSVAVWVYGGFATGIDFITSVPRPPERLGPATGNGNAATGRPTSATTAPGSLANEDTTDDWRHSTQSPAADVSPGIPKKIWQILLPKKPSKKPFVPDPETLEDTPSWLSLNPDYRYTLVGEKAGDDFVQRHFGHDQRIVDAYRKMPNVGMKSDLLRYLILSVEGGVYTDTDTVALKPVDAWVPAGLRDRVALVVGIEYDRQDSNGWADIMHWVQFCQWTIAAAPRHPVFARMVRRVLDALDDLQRLHGKPLHRLAPTSLEVMNSTGPAAWSEVVFEQMQEYDPRLRDFKDLSYMREPRLFGDILVLTIDGFGMGQPHSDSTNDGTVPEAALVRHLFKGGWRGDRRRRNGV